MNGDDIKIEIQHLSMAYGSYEVMRDINARVKRGSVFVIMGGSGTGKSTLLWHMIGLQCPAQGDILYDGQSFWGMDDDARQAQLRKCGVLFQSLLLTRNSFLLDTAAAWAQHCRMDKPIIVCGKLFRPELILHLKHLLAIDPKPSRNSLAREICQQLAWFSPTGWPAVSSAKVALRKLEKRGHLQVSSAQPARHHTHRLRRSGQNLPTLSGVPKKVGQVRGLCLYLLSGADDPHHGLWNDLMIEQHPCGDAPLVGAQLRYLIGSEHGWLGAIGFGPAAFVLGARDEWIGWSTSGRLGHLQQVVGLSRLLIRQEVRCTNLVSTVLSQVLGRLPNDWQARYGVAPLLVETFVDRSCFSGWCFGAANWMRIGASTGRGRLGPKTPSKTLKDIWVFELKPQARRLLREQVALPLTPQPMAQSLAQEDWIEHELAGLDLGDARLNRRASLILRARWNQPQASFYGSFASWTPAKGAYSLIEHKSPDINLASLLAPHLKTTQERMAAEAVVLVPNDTTTLNYTGLRQTSGLGPLGEDRGRGLWLHSVLAVRPDGVPLGLLKAHCWARPEAEDLPKGQPERGRNAKSIDEKESFRWLEALRVAGEAARRMPQTQVVVMSDREGDLYEVHDDVQMAPANLHTLIRAQHDRSLESHQKLWALMTAQPVRQKRKIRVPRAHGQSGRVAVVELRWAQVSIQAPAVGCKKGWPPLTLSVVWVKEAHPPAGVEALDWMLLSDLPIGNAKEAWQKVQWYCRRWGIEEWHRALKSGCGAEQREFKTAEHLQRVLAFDLIMAWRALACVKLGRVLPQLSATAFYTQEELAVLWRGIKKKLLSSQEPNLARG